MLPFCGRERIIDILLEELSARLAERQLKLELTEAAKEYVIDNGYDPVYGARPLKRFLQSSVETLLAHEIIASQLHEGDTLVVDYNGERLTVSVRAAAPLQAQ